MAYSAPIIHAVGDVLTASDWNTSSNDISFLAGAAIAVVATSESTSSGVFTNLTTTGPAVTLTTGTHALVWISAQMFNSGTNDGAQIGIATSGATTIGPIAQNVLQSPSFSVPAAQVIQMGTTATFTNLNAGSNTFTMVYATNGGGTATFAYRQIAVFPLP